MTAVSPVNSVSKTTMMHPFEPAKKKINQLLAMDRMADAIAELKVWATEHEDLYEELNSLSARLASSKNMFRRAEVDAGKFDILQNQIRDAIQQILKDIDQMLDINNMSEAAVRAVALINLGRDSIQAKKFEEALEYFKKALQLKPDDMEALFYRGAAHIAQSKWLDAFEDFSLIIHDAKKVQVHTFALVNRGIIASQLGQSDYACRDWKRVKYELGHPGLVNHLLEQNCTTP